MAHYRMFRSKRKIKLFLTICACALSLISFTPIADKICSLRTKTKINSLHSVEKATTSTHMKRSNASASDVPATHHQEYLDVGLPTTHHQEYLVSKLETYNLTPTDNETYYLKMSLLEEGNKLNTVAVKNKLAPSDIKFPVNNIDFCRNHPVHVLLYVLTTAGNHQQRQAVRETWGRPTNRNGRQYRTLFFVGVVANQTTQDELAKESLVFNGDIIQADVHEDYHNLTLKGIAAIQWMSTYCPDVEYVLKIDDDVLTDLEYLDRVIATQILKQKPARKILCFPWFHAHVFNDPDPRSKFFNPGNLMTTYPTYCSGPMYGYPGSLLPLMHKAATQTPLFTMEDIFFTGLLPPQIKVDGLAYLAIGDVTHSLHDAAKLKQKYAQMEEKQRKEV